MENAGFFSSSRFWCVGEIEMYVQVQVRAGLRTSGIIPHASPRMACSLVSLLAGSELQGSTWLCLQKTGVTNGHHHSQIVQHGFWGLSSGKMSTFPARLLPSLLSVHVCSQRCVHLGEQFCRARQGLDSLTTQTLVLLERVWLSFTLK